MKKIQHLLILCLVGLISFSANAQLDLHFSQFYQSPTNLNPALTGVMNCNIRLTANYRNQWSSVTGFERSFNTYSASYDQRIPVGRFDYFGVGLTLVGDVAGTSDFTTNTAKVSGSYSKRMGGYRDESHYLVVGVDAGISQRSIDFLALRWGTQHNGDGGFDPNLDSQEGGNFDRDNFAFADLSAGLLWFSVLDENNSFFIGGAYSHLNRANISFNGEGDETLFTKVTLHAGGEFSAAGSRVALVPNIVTFFQGPSWQVVPGAAVRFRLGNSRRYYQAFQIGAWARVTHQLDDDTHLDALILTTRFEYEDFGIGFSYDLNTSSLNEASNFNGAFEFSVNYRICGPEKRNVYCPNF